MQNNFDSFWLGTSERSWRGHWIQFVFGEPLVREQLWRSSDETAVTEVLFRHDGVGGPNYLVSCRSRSRRATGGNGSRLCENAVIA
ncbi:hypothetical protein C0Z19_18285 [Trinickia soli]|uniref:Uncharacterized protein n=1 Tax=Trinickia soli TaxID=380675 RepID=A0A2N7VW64_9BURK|nr:hypothetical protein C0Z19_18285 [Trinickia soli]